MAENKDIWQFSGLKIEMRHQKESFLEYVNFIQVNLLFQIFLRFPKK